MRPLLALLIIILTLSASGITSAIASTTSETEEDCCAGGANDSPTDSRDTEERDECPPLCHACACSPTFAIPTIAIPGAFVAIRDRNVHRELSSQLPVGPPGRGVFHPPRVSI